MFGNDEIGRSIG